MDGSAPVLTVTASNGPGATITITSGRKFMLDVPVPATPLIFCTCSCGDTHQRANVVAPLSRWAMVLEYLKVLYR